MVDAVWAVVACDDYGVTIDKFGPDPEALVDEVASWAQQEVEKWPDFGLMYMLITPEEAAELQPTIFGV